MVERRKHPRRRSYLGARLVFGNQYRAVDCLIRDISPTGARIVLPRTDIVPEIFDIFFTERRYTVRACRVWSDPGDIGAAFLESDGWSGSLAAADIGLRRRAEDNASRPVRRDESFR